MATFIDLNNTKAEKISFDKPGEYIAFMHNTSCDFTFSIESEDVDLAIYGLYTGNRGDAYQIFTNQHHISPNSKSRLHIKGVFGDDSKFVYKGLIRIEKGARGTDAYQKNQNLKLGSGAFVESDPCLEILEPDVKCGHGSTTGNVSADQLLYLKSRGIIEEEARKLLVMGFLDEIVDMIRMKIPEFNLDLKLKS